MNKAIVLHSDILGFKEIIQNSEKEADEATLNKLKKVLSESVGSLNHYGKLIRENKTGYATDLKLNFKHFSDNLYASFSYKEGDEISFSIAFIYCVVFSRIYYENMLNNKLQVRGGISFGSDYSEENLIFSYALVKAYELETKKAVFPRIVIDNELVNLFINKLHAPSPFIGDIINNSLLKDQEDIYFISPSGISKDFNAEHGGYKGKELDNVYITQNHRHSKSIISGLDPLNEEHKKIMAKQKWLMEVLWWNYYDQKEQTKANTFSRVTFDITPLS